MRESCTTSLSYTSFGQEELQRSQYLKCDKSQYLLVFGHWNSAYINKRKQAYDNPFKMFSSDLSRDFPETHHMLLSLQLASELEGTDMQCPLNSPSEMHRAGKFL